MGGKKIGQALGATAMAATLATALTACTSSSGDSSAGGGSSEPYQIALSMSYSGNDWQTIAANLIKAQAGTGENAQKVKLRVDVAGTSVPDQIRTIQNEVAAGMDAIVLYPLSPTALNAAIEKACQRGVKVIAYDSYVTAPCAYNVRDNIEDMGYQSMKWLANEVKTAGKTDIGMLTGVAGTTAETEYQKGIDRALAENPTVKVVAREPGLWDPAKAKTSFSSMLASHPNLAGVWGIFACASVDQVLTDRKAAPIPCAGGDTNGERSLILPAADGGKGLNNLSLSVPPYNGQLAFMNAVKLLAGEEVAKDTLLPTEVVTKDTIKLGTDPAQGANVYDPKATSPGFVASFWSPLVEQGLKAAQDGTPDKISDAKPCAEVPGCRTFDKLQTTVPAN